MPQKKRKEVGFEKKLEKFLEFMAKEGPNWTPAEKKILRNAFTHVRNETDLRHVVEYLKYPEVHRFPRVSIDTFLDDPFYLGIGENVYPKIRSISNEIVSGDYREVVLTAGIGAGKSMEAQILATYAAHDLLSLVDPHRYYGLAKDKNIAIMNMGISATQAYEVVFSGITSFIEKSPFFLQFLPNIQKIKILFENEKILLASGNSKSTTPLGYNLFYAVLDEAAFYLDNDNKNVAEDIYEALSQRITSRFGTKGRLVMISSPRYEEDFIMKKMGQAQEVDTEGNKLYDHIYSLQLPSWKVKALREEEKNNPFYFDCRKDQVIRDMTPEDIKKTYKVNLLENEEFDETYDVWEIPSQYKADFLASPTKAKRDFGAVPSLTLEGFFKNPARLKEVYNDKRQNAVVGVGKYKFDERPLRTPYFIHVDIGFNKDGKGDYTGFCMAHADGYIEDEVTKEYRVKVKVDLVERIGFSADIGEVDLEEVRRRIYDLKAMGYYIRLVTYDGYQSRDSLMQLKRKGIKADYLSVDKTIDPYNVLKECFYTNSIDIPYIEELDRELVRLELIKGVKVDHPPGFSKDMADALAGAVYNTVTHTPNSVLNMRAVKNSVDIDPNLKIHLEEKEKENMYRRRQAIIDRQEARAARAGMMGL